MNMDGKSGEWQRRDLRTRIIALGVAPNVAATVAGLCLTEIRREVRLALAAVADAIGSPSGRRRILEAETRRENAAHGPSQNQGTNTPGE
jgi:hypothetical protein